MISKDPAVIEYSVEVKRPDRHSPASMDSLVVSIAPVNDVDSDTVVNRITSAVSRAVGVTPEVAIVAPDDIYSVDERMKPTRLRLDE